MKKYLCFLMAMVMALTLFSTGVSAATRTMSSMTTDGGKTFTAAKSRDVITISTPEEMSLFAAYANAGNNTISVTFQLQNDIDLSSVCHGEITAGAGDAVNWTPIATDPEKPFWGTFEGQGFTLSGLYINDSTATEQGLFGYVKGSIIKDLVISGTSVTVANNSGIVFANAAIGSGTRMMNLTVTDATLNGSKCGGLCYYAGSSNLQNCKFQGTISGGNNGGICYSIEKSTLTGCIFDGTLKGQDNGGIVNMVKNNGTITDCNTTASASVNDVAKGNGGGIVSSTWIDTTDVSSITLKNCVNNATVMGRRYAGGIFANAEAGGGNCVVTIENCTNNGPVEGTSCSGILGSSSGVSTVIKNAKNHGDITCSSSSSAGILGYGGSSTLSLEDCSNDGNITYTGTSSAYIGGILGNVDNKEAEVTMSRCSNHGDINNGGYSGGVIGRMRVKSALVEDCFNTGNLNGLKNNVGGFAGYLELTAPGTITLRYCYSVADTVKGASSVGGFLGRAERSAYGLEDGDAIYLDHCYGVAKNISGTDAGSFAGSIKDSEEIYVNNCYYQAGTAEAVIGNNILPLGTPISKNEKEMKDSSFPGMLGCHYKEDSADAPVNNGYPILLTQVGENAPELKGSGKVSFVVTDQDNVISDPQITVMTRTDQYATAAKDGHFDLSAGDYIYKIVVWGYERICGTFTIGDQNQGEVTIKHTLTACDKGTKWNPHQISTVEELQALAKEVNNGTSYEGEHFLLMNDLDLSGIDWIPIGRSYQYGFRGDFDGGSHFIKNLTVKDYLYAGLFGYLSQGGTVENVFVVDGNVSGSDSVGGIVGFNGNYQSNTYYYAISNCYFKGTLAGRFSGHSAHSGYCIGGIAGGAHSGIKNCGADADISITGSLGYYGAGGIVGFFLGNSDATDINPWGAKCLGVVRDCWYAGTITGSHPSGRIGGIVGYSANSAYCTVENCYAVGTLEGYGENKAYTGYGVSPYKNVNSFGAQKSISQWQDSYRIVPLVVGRVGDTRNQNCYGYKNMMLHGETVTSDDVNASHGADVTAEELLSPVPYTAAGWKTKVWSFAAGYLPAIKGMPGPAPERYDYLRAAAKYFAVSFDTNGGSDVADIVMLAGTIEEPEAPTKEGYTFGGWYSDKECTVSFDFEELITKETTIYAKWEKVENTDPAPNPTPDEPTPAPAPELSFEDVQEGDWFYDDVMNVAQRGIVKGIDDKLFAPNNKLSRGMIVTMLYRLDGEPAVTGDAAFTDVPLDQWYAKAVAWAHQNKIAQGYEDGTFLPNKNISRSELAAFLYRYAQYKEYDTTAKAELSTYEDGSAVADWAKDALSWTIGSGLIKGRTETTIVPQGEATRAEAATIFSRMLKQIEG